MGHILKINIIFSGLINVNKVDSKFVVATERKFHIRGKVCLQSMVSCIGGGGGEGV